MSDLIVNNFLQYLNKERRLSDNTLEAYSRDIFQLKEYLVENDLPNFIEINKTVIITYLLYLQRLGRSNSTISRNLASIRSFYQYLFSNHLIKEDPTTDLKSPKSEKKVPVILTNKEINILLSQPNTTSAKGSRDKAMLELTYASGLRVSQIIALQIKDIDLDNSIIHLKDDKDRVIPLGSKAKNSIIHYLNNFRTDAMDSEPLFLNMRGGSLSRQGFWKIIKYYNKKSSIKKDITPQILRHSFAIHMINNGADINVVKEILGHSDLSTTEAYSFQLTSNKLKDTFKKTHPRA